MSHTPPTHSQSFKRTPGQLPRHAAPDLHITRLSEAVLRPSSQDLRSSRPSSPSSLEVDGVLGNCIPSTVTFTVSTHPDGPRLQSTKAKPDSASLLLQLRVAWSGLQPPVIDARSGWLSRPVRPPLDAIERQSANSVQTNTSSALVRGPISCMRVQCPPRTVTIHCLSFGFLLVLRFFLQGRVLGSPAPMAR